MSSRTTSEQDKLVITDKIREAIHTRVIDSDIEEKMYPESSVMPALLASDVFLIASQCSYASTTHLFVISSVGPLNAVPGLQRPSLQFE
jgi:hypothetical protein